MGIRSSRALRSLVLGVGLMAAPPVLDTTELSDARPPDRPVLHHGASLLRPPLIFEANQGQVHKSIKFLARADDQMLLLTPTEAVLALHRGRARSEHRAAHPDQDWDVLRMQLVGKRPDPQVTGLDPLPGRSNYFLGNDPKAWRTNIPHFGRVKYLQVYPGSISSTMGVHANSSTISLSGRVPIPRGSRSYFWVPAASRLVPTAI